MIPVGVACSCLVVSYLCVYATGSSSNVTGTLSTYTSVTLTFHSTLHPVTREADMEVPFLLKEMLS